MVLITYLLGGGNAQDGFDLDLTYVTSRIIVHGFPATGVGEGNIICGRYVVWAVYM